MGVTTFEATVENGLIRLPSDVKLPDHARVYVIAPDTPALTCATIASPRLAHPEQAADFRMAVDEESQNAGV